LTSKLYSKQRPEICCLLDVNICKMYLVKVQNIILSQIPFLSELIQNYGNILKIGFAIGLILVFGITAKLFHKEILQRRKAESHKS